MVTRETSRSLRSTIWRRKKLPAVIARKLSYSLFKDPPLLCILYVNAVGALLCVAGILVERGPPAAFARRWLWCVMIPVSVALPGYYRYHHMVSVSEVRQA